MFVVFADADAGALKVPEMVWVDVLSEPDVTHTTSHKGSWCGAGWFGC